jgi:hypothetical protein
MGYEWELVRSASEKKSVHSFGDNEGWLEIERREDSVTVSRDHWPGTDTVFMPMGPKSRAGQMTERP